MHINDIRNINEGPFKKLLEIHLNIPGQK
jgi:hypothetical protein